MKFFISYKFAEEDKTQLEDFMKNIKTALNKNNQEILTTFFDAEEFKEKKFNHREIMDRALDYINKSDKVICIIKSKEKSEGMILEIGYAIAKNKEILLFIKEDIESRWIMHYAKEVIKFKDLEELYKKLEKIKLILN